MLIEQRTAGGLTNMLQQPLGNIFLWTEPGTLSPPDPILYARQPATRWL